MATLWILRRVVASSRSRVVPRLVAASLPSVGSPTTKNTPASDGGPWFLAPRAAALIPFCCVKSTWAIFVRNQQLFHSTPPILSSSIRAGDDRGVRASLNCATPKPASRSKGAGLYARPIMLGAAMMRLILLGITLHGLATTVVASELHASATSTIHAALWPLSAPGSVYPSARVVRLRKPQSGHSGDQNDFTGRFEGQEPVRALTPNEKEAIRAALSGMTRSAAAAPAPITNPRDIQEFRERAQEDQDEALKRSERVGRRAILSICDGCIKGPRSSARAILRREHVGEDGLAYRAEDLR
jgi:hypothetical protein